MNGPNEFDLWAVMRQLQGLPLPLGQAPVWDGGEQRAGEEYASACGFPAAFGPLLFQRATRKVFGKVFASGVSVLPAQHTAYMFEKFWEKEVAPFDATERFFRLVTDSDCGGGISKEELRPFIQAIACRHEDLSTLSPDEMSAYVDTVLAVIFYKLSRREVVRLPELRESGFVASLSAVGRLESGLEGACILQLPRCSDSYIHLFLLPAVAEKDSRSDELPHAIGNPTVTWTPSTSPWLGTRKFERTTFLSAAVDGAWGKTPWSGTGISTADRWSAPSAPKGIGGESITGRPTEALTSGEFTERDLEYCFQLADEAGTGQIGLHAITPFYEDVVRAVLVEAFALKLEFVKNGGNPEEFGSFGFVFEAYLDAIGIQKGRQYITLAEMGRPENVALSSVFFAQLFLGLIFQDSDSAVNEGEGMGPPSLAPPVTVASTEKVQKAAKEEEDERQQEQEQQREHQHQQLKKDGDGQQQQQQQQQQRQRKEMQNQEEYQRRQQQQQQQREEYQRKPQQQQQEYNRKQQQHQWQRQQRQQYQQYHHPQQRQPHHFYQQQLQRGRNQQHHHQLQQYQQQQYQQQQYHQLQCQQQYQQQPYQQQPYQQQQLHHHQQYHPYPYSQPQQQHHQQYLQQQQQQQQQYHNQQMHFQQQQLPHQYKQPHHLQPQHYHLQQQQQLEQQQHFHQQTPNHYRPHQQHRYHPHPQHHPHQQQQQHQLNCSAQSFSPSTQAVSPPPSPPSPPSPSMPLPSPPPQQRRESYPANDEDFEDELEALFPEHDDGHSWVV
eukprot:jgi/Undpi1/2891/HiC_scaffold_14.g06268.m1